MLVNSIGEILKPIIGAEISRVRVGPAGVYLDFSVAGTDGGIFEIFCCGKMIVLGQTGQARIAVEGSDYIDRDVCDVVATGGQVRAFEVEESKNGFMLDFEKIGQVVFGPVNESPSMFLTHWKGEPGASDSVARLKY